MKKRFLPAIVAATLAYSLFAGCGNNAESASSASASASSAPASESVSASSAEVSEPEVVEEAEPVNSLLEIKYENADFDFSDAIKEQKESAVLVPEKADIEISTEAENNAAGVVLVKALAEDNTTDYYLNTYTDGVGITITPNDSAAIASVVSSVNGDVSVAEDGTAVLVPASINLNDPVDEIFTVTMEDGAVYDIHTMNETMPVININVCNVAAENAGVYSISPENFLIRLDTEGKLVYYRDINCLGGKIDNFAKFDTPDGEFYSYFAELEPNFRNARGGWASGMYVVMNENYEEIDYPTLLPNDDPNHTHGEGYTEYHEFVIIGENHYLVLSYTALLTSNLPEGVEGLDGGNTAYVYAGIVQEVKDGKVIAEINTTDYPKLFAAANESNAYENSTDQGADVVLSEELTVFSPGDGYMDYAHINSLDYTLKADGTVDKLLVSFHNLSSIVQFDMTSGAAEWILGGKLNSMSGFNEYASERTDEKGVEFTALSYGQHFARYANISDDRTIDGNPVISVFDNQNGTAPWMPTAQPVPTLTRTFEAVIDEAAGTATVENVINGVDLNKMTDKYHISSHCGSVQYKSDSSVVIGWGLHAIIDGIGAGAPEGTISDEGYPDLRIGSHPVVSEFDLEKNEITFELSLLRNPSSTSSSQLCSYRTYKNAD